MIQILLSYLGPEMSGAVTWLAFTFVGVTRSAHFVTEREYADKECTVMKDVDYLIEEACFLDAPQRYKQTTCTVSLNETEMKMGACNATMSTGECAGSYEECVAAARRECDVDFDCKAVQVHSLYHISFGYQLLPCLDTVNSTEWNHLPKDNVTQTWYEDDGCTRPYPKTAVSNFVDECRFEDKKKITGCGLFTQHFELGYYPDKNCEAPYEEFTAIEPKDYCLQLQHGSSRMLSCNNETGLFQQLTYPTANCGGDPVVQFAIEGDECLKWDHPSYVLLGKYTRCPTNATRFIAFAIDDRPSALMIVMVTALALLL